MRLVSYVPPPPHSNILFGHKITNPRFSNPSLSLWGTWSVINDISTQIFNAQIDPGAHSLAPTGLLNAIPFPALGVPRHGKISLPDTLGHHLLVWTFSPKENTTSPPSRRLLEEDL